MKKSLKVFLLYVILMLADGGLTLYNTPDLSLEGNPLVTQFHLGWGALMAVNLISCLLVFIACRYTFDKYKTLKADVPNLKAYISQLFYNRPDKFIWSFYKFPKNWKPFWALMGYAAAYALCAGRAILVLEWLAVTFGLDMSGYDRFRDAVFFGRLDIAVALIFVVLLIFVWISKEYKKSCISATTDK